jgi:two-component system, LytTR family, response regulator
LDYIMKPITVERMQKSLDRYRRRYTDLNQARLNEHFSIRSFGRFAVESRKHGMMRFRTAKTEELMAFLLYHHKSPVSKERIIDELWYDRDLERAQSIFYTTLYQLRKDLEAIGLNHIIQHSRREGDGCRIIWSPDDWDYLEFNKGYQKFKTGSLSSDAAKHLVSLYDNGYLTENGYSWAEERRNEFELKYSEIIEYIADCEIDMNRYELALQALKNWTKQVPFHERAHTKIIALYLLMNNREMASKYYIDIQKMFKEEIGSPIHIDIEFIALNPKALFNL